MTRLRVRRSRETGRAIHIATTLAGAMLVAACSDVGTTTTDPTPTATGAIRVTVTMTGVDLPDVYSVRDQYRTVFAGRGQVAEFERVLPGEQRVEVMLPANCQVTDANPRSVTVVAGEVATVAFTVTCVSTTGFLRVTVSTTGTELDANGYDVTAIGRKQSGSPFAQTETVTMNGTTVITVPVGSMTVVLAGMTLNCFSTASNPQPVTVLPSDTTSVAFPITCGPKSDLAFVGPTGNGDIYLVSEDGRNVRQLTDTRSLEADPAWSPDGSRLAFTSDRDGNLEIYIMNADGSGVTRVTDDPAADYQPSWSPDGRQIAFASTRTGDAEIYVVPLDGSAPVRLTSSAGNDFSPAWSPNGRLIAFTSTREGTTHVYTMHTDGSEVTRLTPEEARYPAWSPDGVGFAYSATFCSYYYVDACHPVVMISKGSPVAGPFVGERASWSPDSRKIAFNAFDCDFYSITCAASEVFRIARLDGTDVVAMPAGSSPAWRPR